jgi:hypothetical protein
MLGLNWFISDPIDFEHKNYLLLSYVGEVEDSYSKMRLSPYLLWTEKLVNELKLFRSNLENFENSIKKDLIGFSKSGLIYSEVKKPEKLDEIVEIVEYSKPILECKLEVGYKLFKKYPQVLHL